MVEDLSDASLMATLKRLISRLPGYEARSNRRLERLSHLGVYGLDTEASQPRVAVAPRAWRPGRSRTIPPADHRIRWSASETRHADLDP